jgi:predicted metal-dependent hydrolase
MMMRLFVLLHCAQQASIQKCILQPVSCEPPDSVMSPVTINLNGCEVAYVLKRSRRRTLGFSISRDGLVVAAPLRLGQREIDRGLREKSGWILGKLDEWARRPKPQELILETGAQLPWLGGKLVLDIEEKGVRTLVRRSGNRLSLSVDPQLHGALRERTLKSAITRYYKREGHGFMAPKVEAYAQRLGKSIAGVQIRDQKRRWGSCAPDGMIRLNWRLMGFPEPLVDYVCAHEAAHLVEANHSAAYWRVVESLLPDWKESRRRMREQADLWIAY